MYRSLDEKRCTFELFFHYFPLQPFQSVHRENKLREVLNKDPVTKTSSTNSQFLGQPNPNTRSAKTSVLNVIELSSPSELLYSYIQGFLSVIKNS